MKPQVLLVDTDPTRQTDEVLDLLLGAGYGIRVYDQPQEVLSGLRTTTTSSIAVLVRRDAHPLEHDNFFFTVWADADLAARHRYISVTGESVASDSVTVDGVRERTIVDYVLTRLGVPVIAARDIHQRLVRLVDTLNAQLGRPCPSPPQS